jgi:hypothetical protein
MNEISVEAVESMMLHNVAEFEKSGWKALHVRRTEARAETILLALADISLWRPFVRLVLPGELSYRTNYFRDHLERRG